MAACYARPLLMGFRRRREAVWLAAARPLWCGKIRCWKSVAEEIGGSLRSESLELCMYGVERDRAAAGTSTYGLPKVTLQAVWLVAARRFWCGNRWWKSAAKEIAGSLRSESLELCMYGVERDRAAQPAPLLMGFRR